MGECRCGCGAQVRGKRVFANKEHQLAWMSAGGAAEMNRLQPIEAKIRGGAVAGREAADSGRLAEAGMKGAERSREIAESFRTAHGKTPDDVQ
jgi:general stress protein YciG